MKIQDKATNVLQRTSHILRAQQTSTFRARLEVAEPAWFRVVAKNPPTQNLAYKAHNLEYYKEKSVEDNVRPEEPNQETGFYSTRRARHHSTQTKHLFTPHKIEYFEDNIRSLFYQQHPWELARPKLVIETDGKDQSRQDWSRLDQLSKKLDGESVVQHTLYLLKNDPEFKNSDSWLPAYEKARAKYYRLRIREDTRTQVAIEEANLFGAVFGKTEIEKGYAIEEKYVKKWEKEAIEETKIKAAKNAAPGAGAPGA